MLLSACIICWLWQMDEPIIVMTYSDTRWHVTATAFIRQLFRDGWHDPILWIVEEVALSARSIVLLYQRADILSWRVVSLSCDTSIECWLRWIGREIGCCVQCLLVHFVLRLYCFNNRCIWLLRVTRSYELHWRKNLLCPNVHQSIVDDSRCLLMLMLMLIVDAGIHW